MRALPIVALFGILNCGCDQYIFVKGKVVDAKGVPIGGAEVNLDIMNNPRLAKHCITSEKGEYRVSETYAHPLFGAPEITLSAEKEGYKSHSEALDYTDQRLEHHTITLEKDAEPQE
ncbi:MAG: carboxypeptidase-like regulatory domain-containing protein [Candidatus Hydrogenedentes bacterium]|nr:carboxypeptidase-like regulatory domain-containing protein [Candidatus Hydrogenedentota bacterium]